MSWSNGMNRSERPTKKEEIVFVVHGRDEDLRQSMFDYLRSIGLYPLEWEQVIRNTGEESSHISRILEDAFSSAQAVLVLLSGDDLVMLQEHLQSDDDPGYERELTPQARPNVLFKAGMAIGKNEERTILIEIGSTKHFSDFSGLHVIKLDNSAEKRKELADKLRTVGCNVDTSGTDWLEIGDFGSSVQVDGLEETPEIDIAADWLDYDLDQLETDILAVFAKDRQARHYSSDIAAQFDLSDEVAQYHLDRLVRMNLLQTTQKLTLVPQLYFLAGLGWSYLVENGLIE
jgi:predicted nucleotide-binding protein